MTEPLRLLDLFAGIGGFSLGLERSGAFRTVAFCEINPHCRAVLAKHWPGVPCYDDAKALTGRRLRADGIAVDAISAGFPCQDVSLAGKGAGLAGKRSGLWAECARLIREIRPRVVIVENAPGLLSRGFGRVLGDLAALGFDAEWHCIPASAIGAKHHRDRVWVVAYADRERCGQADRVGARHPSADFERDETANRARHAGPVDAAGRGVANADRPGLEEFFTSHQGQFAAALGARAWAAQPGVGRVAYGVPARVDRIRALGNAAVPQITEILGRGIAAAGWGNR